MKKKSPFGHDINKDFLRKITGGGAHYCPHCGQQASAKPHVANNKLVQFLATLERYKNVKGVGWYTTKDLTPQTQHQRQKLSNDSVSTARYMGLIQVADDALEGVNPPPGSYRMLDEGTQFLMGFERIPERVWAYNGEVLFSSKTMYDVSQAFGGLFNYGRHVEGIVVEVHTGKGIVIK